MTISNELRPCLVNDKKCLLHCWEQHTNMIPVRGGHPIGLMHSLNGIVEDDRGLIFRVNPMDIRFTDNKHSEYSWEEK